MGLRQYCMKTRRHTDGARCVSGHHERGQVKTTNPGRRWSHPLHSVPQPFCGRRGGCAGADRTWRGLPTLERKPAPQRARASLRWLPSGRCGMQRAQTGQGDQATQEGCRSAVRSVNMAKEDKTAICLLQARLNVGASLGSLAPAIVDVATHEEGGGPPNTTVLNRHLLAHTSILALQLARSCSSCHGGLRNSRKGIKERPHNGSGLRWRGPPAIDAPSLYGSGLRWRGPPAIDAPSPPGLRRGQEDKREHHDDQEGPHLRGGSVRSLGPQPSTKIMEHTRSERVQRWLGKEVGFPRTCSHKTKRCSQKTCSELVST
jgi:hypothetical protein